MTEKKKIYICTTSRADYNLLKYLIIEILQDYYFDLKIIVTGSHLSQEFGNTIDFIYKDNIPVYKKIPFLISGDSPEVISKCFSVCFDGFSNLFSIDKPDLIIILGDRYELLSITIPAAIQRIPIAHIHGGELSEGAIDDSVRHSVTKFSHLHFVSCETYRKRVIQMGEDPNSVFNVGAMALDYIHEVPDLDLPVLQEKLNFDLQLPFFLVTYHPVTLLPDMGQSGLKALLEALNNYLDYQIIFTGVNFDTGYSLLRDSMEEFSARNTKNIKIFKSLEGEIYINLLKKASLFIGNSSSGIIESPYIGTPFINIGDRQKSRERCSLISDVEENSKSISKSIQEMLPKKQEKSCSDFPYGTKGAAKKILAVLKNMDWSKISHKKFFDMLNLNK